MSFSRTCGIAPFGSASFEPIGGDFHAINVGCLEDVSAEELAATPIRYEDGLHDRWDEQPAVTRCL